MFSETVNTAQRKKIACIPAFTERLPLGKLCIITTFASSFLAFSFIFSDSEFKYIQENSRFSAFIDNFRHGRQENLRKRMFSSCRASQFQR